MNLYRILRSSLTIAIISIYLVSCASYPVYAQEAEKEEGTAIVEQGQKAPFSGLLFNEKKANELRNNQIELRKQVELNSSLSQSLNLEQNNYKLSETKANALLEQNTKMAQELRSERSMSGLERIFWFGLGAVLTGAAAYGVTKTLK